MTVNKVGIIGCGAVTQKSYLENLPRIPNLSIAYINDINQELASTIAKKINAQSVTIDEMIQYADIIIIATPPSTHFEILKKVVVSGKKVICEKPFLPSPAEVDQILALAASSGCELFVAHFRRTFPTVKLARNLIRTNILGDVKKICIYEGGRFSWNTESGYVFNEATGGVLFDTGSHTIDMALYASLLDQPMLNDIKITSLKRDKKEPSHEIKVTSDLIFENNTVACEIILSRYQVLANKIRIECTNGFIELPVILTDYIKIGRDNSFEIIYTHEKYDVLMDCFTLQFKEMLNTPYSDSVFSAKNFKNLTSILNKISNS